MGISLQAWMIPAHSSRASGSHLLRAEASSRPSAGRTSCFPSSGLSWSRTALEAGTRPAPSLPRGEGAEEEAREAAAGRGCVVRALGVGWARFPGPPGPANNGRLWKEAAGMQPGESGGGAAAAAAGGRGRGAGAASYLSR